MRTSEQIEEMTARLDEKIERELDVHKALGDLEAFLQDPVGFGDFDYADPITLDEFSIAPRMHGRFIDVIS